MKGPGVRIVNNIRVTVTAYAPGGIQDELGIEAGAYEARWISSDVTPAATAVFVIPGSVWSRIRPKLNKLAQRRIPAYNLTTGVPLGAGRTMPLLTYTADWVPQGRPRVHQIEGAPLSLASPANLTLRGTGFLGATYATASIWQTITGYARNTVAGVRSVPRTVEVFRITSLIPGPAGNNIAVRIRQPASTGAVAFTRESDGTYMVTVTPLTGASNTTAIAAQINGDAVASLWVSATAVVASIALSPTLSASGTGTLASSRTNAPSGDPRRDAMRLTGGDGSAQARLSLVVSSPSYANRLYLLANKAGNDGNLITITLNMSQGSNTVSVSGNDITVNRTGATETLANLVTAINGNASAAALVTASAIGSGSLGATAKTWLHSGAGEAVTVTVAGATARVVSQTDTALVIATTNANLVAAGVATGEIAVIQLSMHFGSIGVTLGAVTA